MNQNHDGMASRNEFIVITQSPIIQLLQHSSIQGRGKYVYVNDRVSVLQS